MSVAYNSKTITKDMKLCMDFANPKSFSPNVFPLGRDIYTWYTSKRGNSTGKNCTVEQDPSTSRSPAGGIPMKMNVTGNDPYISSYDSATWNISSVLNTQTWRVSVYAKASVNTNSAIFIFGADANGDANPTGTFLGITAKSFNVTTEWQRFDHFITFNNASIVNIQMRLDGPDSGGEGQTVWWDGLQVEPVSLTRFNAKQNTNYANTFNLIDGSTESMFSYPVYDNAGFLTFSETENYIEGSAGTLGSVITVEMLAKFKNLTSAYMSFGFTSYNVSGGNGQLGFNTANSDRYGLTAAQVTSLGLVDNWKHYCFVMVNNTSLSSNPYTNNRIYVNGVSYPLSQTAGTQSPTVRTFTNGAFRTPGWMSNTLYRMPMDLATFRIYDRQLTDNEILQNFNALKGRFIL